MKAEYILYILIAFVIIALIGGLLVKWLWNMVVPELFGLPIIGFGQAVALWALAQVLFGTGKVSRK
jgi:hypothetical protein